MLEERCQIRLEVEVADVGLGGVPVLEIAEVEATAKTIAVEAEEKAVHAAAIGQETRNKE